jgi:hypothetical protein
MMGLYYLRPTRIQVIEKHVFTSNAILNTDKPFSESLYSGESPYMLNIPFR